MKTNNNDGIYCESFEKISDLLACISNDEVISRKDSYKIEKLLEKCYREVIRKIKKGGIKDKNKASLAKDIFEREYMWLTMNPYELDPDEDYYYPMYVMLKDWDSHCKYCDIKYDRIFCEEFLHDYDLFNPVHI